MISHRYHSCTRVSGSILTAALVVFVLGPSLATAQSIITEIIGEAKKRIASIDPETAGRIGDYPQIIAFRNLLIHGYEHIDVVMVSNVIRDGLPVLLSEVETLLRESEASP